MNVFTYGTLMYSEVFEKVIPEKGKYSREKAFLPGYARMQVKNKPYPGLLESDSSKLLEGVVYKGIN